MPSLRQQRTAVRSGDPRGGTSLGRRASERSSLMNIGKRVDYALRALSYLAAQPPNHVVSRREIQIKQDIPAHFLSKIMKRLESGGFVQSYMGARGGFSLKRIPTEINLKEVYECLEGPLLLMGCLEEGERACRYCAVCSQISIWHEAQRLLANYLAGISLQQIARRVGLREELALWGQRAYLEPPRGSSEASQLHDH